jgi:putative membrane protein
MVRDHGKANVELRQLAERKSVTLPKEMNAEHSREADRIAKLRGDAFDTAYMQQMVKDHEADVAEFRQEAKAAADPDVKAFAAKTLPTLESHLQMSKDIAAKLNRATSGRRPHAD